MGIIYKCSVDVSCALETGTIEFQGSVMAAYQHSNLGWSSAAMKSYTANVNTDISGYGSLLVRTANVPIPASVWLFCSGLLGLLGITRRKA
jgi:hypothetical protein